MANKILAPSARFLLESYCDIKVGHLMFYRVKDTSNYRMLVFDENQNLIHDKEKTFKNIDECLLELINALPEEPREENA